MYGINAYGEMISDGGRMEAYARALRDVVKPGHVVLDIGTGTGVAAMIASRLGARKVFAVEPNDAVWLARRIAQANGLGDRIEFIQAVSTAITLPERADVIVSDLRGILPPFQKNLEAIIDARTRHLAPGGVMIPRSDTLWAAAVDAPESYARVDAPWQVGRFGLDLSAARDLAVNSFLRMKDPGAIMSAGPAPLGTIDYRVVNATDFSGEARLPVHRPGRPNGVCVWFDSVLAEGVEISNAPSRPPLVYGRAFFPWPEPVPVESGDEVEVGVAARLVGEDYIWQWNTRVHSARLGRCVAQTRQSEFLGELMSPQSLRRRGASYIPNLNEEGRIDTLILSLMETAAPLGDIARAVAARYPQRFPRWQDALGRVGELSTRYSR